MASIAVVEPSERAWELAVEMADADDVMQEILEETVDSGQAGEIMESGRTVCDGPGGIKGPMQRFPTSVKLASCPWGLAGAWHTHTTPNELRRPSLSLPDMATVIYGELDVVGVVGTEQAEFLTSPTDNHDAAHRFNDIIGFEGNSSTDIAEGIIDGDINPVAARQAARSELDDLFLTIDTGYTGLDGAVAGIFDRPAIGPAQYDTVEAHTVFHPHVDWERETWADEFRQKVRRCNHGLQQTAESSSIDLSEVVIGTAIGTMVSGVVNHLVFN